MNMYIMCCARGMYKLFIQYKILVSINHILALPIAILWFLGSYAVQYCRMNTSPNSQPGTPKLVFIFDYSKTIYFYI